MRLLIISFAIICFYSCGSSKETDKEPKKGTKLDFLEQRITAINGKLDSAKKAGADSNWLETYSALIEFLKDEKAKIKSGN